MKPNVLVVSADERLKTGIKAHVTDVCTISTASAGATLLSALEKKDFAAVVVDSRLPGLDGATVLHALRHFGRPDLFVVSAGFFDPMTALGAQQIVHRWVSLPPTPSRSIWETLRAVLDPRSARTIQEARFQSREKTFFVTFRNGKTYELSRKVIEADDGSAVMGQPHVVDGGDAFVVRLASGQQYDVAADFVLYHHEPTYPYHKDRPDQRAREAQRGEWVGRRVRDARAQRGLTQEALAEKSGMHAPNLSRLESGKHVPSLETLERVAEALGVRVADLLAV